VLYISQASDIRWNSGLYLTVIRDYGIFLKQPYLNPRTGVLYMDRDVEYSGQHDNWTPFVNMGGDRVVWLTDVSLAINLSASAWVPGSSISSYSWTTSGGVLANSGTATPTLTVTAVGTYQLDCLVVAANTKRITGHRTVTVIKSSGNLVTDFALEVNPSWSYERGGWEFGVRMWGQADVRDRQKVILLARDMYDETEISIGQVTGCENIIAVGWIAGESIEPSPDGSSIYFDVRGAHHWLGIQDGALMDLTNTGATSAAAWTEIKNMTVDLALCHALHWRTTVPTVMDVTLTTDTRQAGLFQEQKADLWQQMTSISERILAAPNTDNLNSFFVAIDPQFIPVGDRGSIPVIMDVTKPDWEALQLERVTEPSCAMLHMIGEAFVTRGVTKNYYAIANGTLGKRYGEEASAGAALVTSQAQLNELTGLAIAARNNAYPEIGLELTQYNKGISGTPTQYISLTVAAEDTPRNIGISVNIIPRSITHAWDEGNSAFLTSVSGDAAVVDDIAIREIIPAEAPPPASSPATISIPAQPVPEYVAARSRIGRVIIRDDYNGIYYTDNFGPTSEWSNANMGLIYNPLSITKMLVTGLKNVVVSYEYVYRNPETQLSNGLWAAAPGGTFRQILDYATIEAGVGSTDDYRLFVAVSPFNDAVAVIAQPSSYNSPHLPRMFVGTTTGGFTAGATLSHHLRPGNQPWQTLSYGDGIWRFTYWDAWEFEFTEVLHFSIDGSAIVYNSGSINVFGSVNNIYPLTTGGDFWLPWDGNISHDNGLTFAAFPPARPTGEQIYNQAIAVNEDASVIMWASAQSLSLDEGVTWQDFASFPGDPLDGSRFFYYPASNGSPEWLASVYLSGVVNSLDNGATWVACSGNLLDVFFNHQASIVEIFGI
jgi:hypothetical protein